MEVASFRVSKKTKKEMKEVGINWSEELREFVEKRIREYKRKKALEKVDAMLSKVKTAPKGTAQQLVREDRDSH